MVEQTSQKPAVLGAPAHGSSGAGSIPPPEEQHPTIEELPRFRAWRRDVPGLATSRREPWLATRRREIARAAVGFGVVCLVVAGMVLSGAAQELEQLLETDGFDPERAWLLTALSATGVATFAAGLVTGQRRVPALLGVIGLVWVFGSTFWTETQSARGVKGAFDPAGWLLTVVTLLVSAVIAGWAAATLGSEVRNSLFATWRRSRALWDQRGPLGLGNRRIGATLAVVLVVLICVPALSDMINYSPDTRFRTGRGGISLLGGGGDPTSAPIAGASGAPGTPAPSGLAGDTPAPSTGAGASPAPDTTAGPVSAGAVHTGTLPAPWKGGPRTTLSVWVYTPGEYATSDPKAYPVVYLVPMPFATWQQGAHIQELLDTLIGSGQLPPMIVAFVGGPGGPYPDSECADSVDGQQQMETFMSTTLPQWVDSNYRTIADAQHRTIGGYSNGAFCSSMLLLAHPDVFRQAIAFGGYYTAGIESSQTVNAWRPWNRDAAAIAAHSPVLMAGALPADVRSKVFLFVSGSATAPFFGQQYTDFEKALTDAGIPHQFLDTPAAHSWPTVQAALPRALKSVMDRIASGAGK